MAQRRVVLRLSEILHERNMTQRELAELSGLHENTITNLVRGPVRIELDTIRRLSEALGLEPGDLIVYEED